MIKEYFANYFLHMSDVTFDMRTNAMQVHQPQRRAMEGDAGRHRRGHDDRRPLEAASTSICEGEEAFCFTYGDGVADIDITKLVDSSPPPRQAGDGDRGPAAGALSVRSSIDGSRVAGFTEKPKGDGGLDQRRLLRAVARRCLDLIEGDDTTLGGGATDADSPRRASCRPSATGFWQPMDTLRDKNHLEELWAAGTAPWKIWRMRR